MNNEQWWAAERKAAEFWRKVKENQMGARPQQPASPERRGANSVERRVAGRHQQMLTRHASHA
jgi:hypothetical protein